MKKSEELIDKISTLNDIIVLASDMVKDNLFELDKISSGDHKNYKVESINRNEILNRCILSIRKKLWHERLKLQKPKCADDYLRFYKEGWSVDEWVEELMYQWAESRTTVYRNFKTFGIEPKKIKKNLPTI